MAHTKFGVEVLTPEGEVFNDEVEMVSTRTAIGSIGILANHEPLLAMLDPTELRLYRSESEIVRLAQGEGYLQMIDNHLLILVEEARRPDHARYIGRCATGFREAESNESGGRGLRAPAARRARQRRWEAFLRIAEPSLLTRGYGRQRAGPAIACDGRRANCWPSA